MTNFFKSLTLAAILLTAPALAMAQSMDWQATRLRGDVFVMYDDAWRPLSLGDTVPNGHFLYTDDNGRVVLERGAEQISVARNTQIMVESQGMEGEPTTVFQYLGEITVNVATQSEPYFVVRTHQLAAVVKGTRFVVITDGEASEVVVRRGLVEVQDVVRQTHVDVHPGQKVQLATNSEVGLQVEGRGPVSLVVPIPEGRAIGLGGSIGEMGAGNAAAGGSGNGGNGSGGLGSIGLGIGAGGNAQP